MFLISCSRWVPARAFAAVAATILSVSITQSQAQTNIYSDPVGFIKLNVEPGPAKFSFLGLGMTQVVTNRGLVTGVDGNKISVNNTLVAGAFNWLVGPPTNFTHFIEITSGPNAGLFDDIVSNDTTAVFTASDISSLVAQGDSYKIYPHWTLAKVFGPTNEAGLQPGTSDANSDNVRVWDTAAQGFAIYYYKTNSVGGGIGWRAAGSPTVNRANTPLYIDQGIVVFRRSLATATNITLLGGVKLGKTIAPVEQGPGRFTFVANTYPAPISLGASGLYTTNSATGLQPGTSDANSDNVRIWDPVAQGYAIYYYKTNTTGGGVGWRRAGAPTIDASSTNIQVGASAVILRRSVTTPFNWEMPQPFNLQ